MEEGAGAAGNLGLWRRELVLPHVSVSALLLPEMTIKCGVHQGVERLFSVGAAAGLHFVGLWVWACT